MLMVCSPSLPTLPRISLLKRRFRAQLNAKIKTEFIIRNNLVTSASTSVLASQHSGAVNLVVSWVLTELLELMFQLLLEVLEVVF